MQYSVRTEIGFGFTAPASFIADREPDDVGCGWVVVGWRDAKPCSGAAVVWMMGEVLRRSRSVISYSAPDDLRPGQILSKERS